MNALNSQKVSFWFLIVVIILSFSLGWISSAYFNTKSQIPEITQIVATNSPTVDEIIDPKEFLSIKYGDWLCKPDHNGNMVITGTVKNTSPTIDLRNVEMLGIIYDINNNLVNNAIGYLESDILFANSSAKYSITVWDPDNLGEKCMVRAESARFK